MPRIDNGTGRDISKWNGTLEKALIARKDMLNKCKTNNDLIDILMDCEKDGLSMNGTDYTDRLIATISSNPNFHKNFQNVYNVILKGTGNGVLKCSAKKTSKKISESEGLNPIGGSVCIAVYELFSDYMESGMSAVDAFRRALRDAKVEFEGDVDAAAFFNQIKARCRTIRDFNELAAQYNVCDWGSEEDRTLFMDDAEYEDYLNSRI